jgi:high-affinity Fe2+/Pb2+ permease
MDQAGVLVGAIVSYAVVVPIPWWVWVLVMVAGPAVALLIAWGINWWGRRR